MQAQADSGRLDAAIDSAEDALTLSRAYAANVRRMIAEAERDVTRVDYVRTLRPELTAAAAHLDRRIHVDGTFLRHLENLRADASEEQDPIAVRQLTRASSRLSDAVETLAGLQTDVVSATPRWRDAQAAQAFTAVPPTEIDPTVDVLSAVRVVVMSPMVTATASAPGSASSCPAMCGDSSIPYTAIPRALSGSATRPVPTANSSAGPPRASSASRSTMGPRTDGPNLAA
jgi:hypothetical protein